MNANDLVRLGVRVDRTQEWFPYLESAMLEFSVNTPARQAAFLAQILHESGMLRYATEIWGPTSAQSRYEGRADLGNTEPGDGIKFRGRGLIQTTGRSNYQAVGDALGVDLILQPELLAEPELAARSAGWFWREHGLNELSDDGEFAVITKRINGGLNGYSERFALYQAAEGVLT